MRLLSLVTTFGLFLGASIYPAAAQEGVKDLAAKASAELRLLNSFQTLERMTSQLNHFLTYGIVAERGGWGVVEFVDTTNYKNSNVIRNTGGDVQVEIARANSSILKSKVATDDELGNTESAVESLNSLIALTPKIADLVAGGQLDAAALLYHEVGQPAYEDALRSVQSNVGTVQKRLGKTLVNIRIAK